MQLSANLCDAANTNFFPSVFRPLFVHDLTGNVFITGYLQVTNVSGTFDPQLAAPHRVIDLASLEPAYALIDNGSGSINAYGVPWIIGAKKGLPNFNQLSLVNAAQVTRKLEVTRTSADPATAIYQTNQMYDLSISNFLGLSFWNSYSQDYPRPLTIYAHDFLFEQLSNSTLPIINAQFDINGIIQNSWPGSHWSGNVPNQVPQSSSFVKANWSTNYLSDSIAYVAPNSPLAFPVFPWTSPGLIPFTPVALLVTNYLQAYILDGTSVIDYVQLDGPVSVGVLSQALADPDYPDTNAPNIFYQWSTNTYQDSPPTLFGVINQIWVSGHPGSAPIAGGKWSVSPTPMGITTPEADAAYFNGFFVPSFQFQGQTYVNNQLAIQAPYTPSRTVFSSFLLQANDPLVHYLASDLEAQVGTIAVWSGNQLWQNGNWYKVDDFGSQPLPTPPATPIGGRYQPWLRKGQMNALSGAVPTTNNYAGRDPLVYGSDYWGFPSNLMSSLSNIGQVHRGTPWQTFYLKDANLIKVYNVNGANYLGTNTWAQWTGDLDATDATLMAPVSDWRLAGLLMPLLSTNDPAQLFSVNTPNIVDWQNFLNGLVVYSNSASFVFASAPLQITTNILAGNSPQASTIVAGPNGIFVTKMSQPGQSFRSIGDILATPALSVQSPFLHLGTAALGNQQTNYGITDWEYEALPAQLLPLLRPDSIGKLTLSNGGLDIQFSVSDGYVYQLQTSTNLTDWQNLGTNQPVQGILNVLIVTNASSPNHFYRTVLLPQ